MAKNGPITARMPPTAASAQTRALLALLLLVPGGWLAVAFDPLGGEPAVGSNEAGGSEWGGDGEWAGRRLALSPPENMGAVDAAEALLRLVGELGELQQRQLRSFRLTRGGHLRALTAAEKRRHAEAAAGGDAELAAVGEGDAALLGGGDAYHARTHVLLTLPRSAVLSAADLASGRLAHFVRSPRFLEHLGRARLRPPQSFLFALFVLYVDGARGRPHAEPLWQA